MEFFPFILGTIFCLALLICIAFPRVLDIRFKYKKVGSTYWGFYQGASPDEPAAEKTIECQEPAAFMKPVVGSSLYAAGRVAKGRSSK